MSSALRQSEPEQTLDSCLLDHSLSASPSLSPRRKPMRVGRTNRRAALTIAVCSLALILAAGCATPLPHTSLTQTSLYAPAELLEPYVPNGQLVEAESATALTLPEALVYADRRAPAILAAEALVGLADAEVVGASPLLPANPALDVDFGGRTIDARTGIDLQIGVSQEFEIAGQRERRAAAARTDRVTAVAQVNEVRWAVHVEVHRVFVALLVAGERRAQATDFVAFSESLRTTAVLRVEAGESAPLILLVADADLARTQETLSRAEESEAALRTTLAALIGWPSEATPPAQGTLPGVRRAPPIKVLMERMATQHPALRTRELAVVAQNAHVVAEDRDAWPSPTLGAGYARESAPGAEADADIWTLSLSVPLPLWRTNQGGRARARAQLAIADQAREATALRLRSEVVRARLMLDASVDRVGFYETTIVPQLQKNLRALQRAYELGEVDLHQVSQTRASLLSATDHYLRARAEYYQACAELEGLVGAELWPHEDPE
jgi:cobalt-zinc-cadmium efflux system outer membrane protein